jgi:hypothetical protein
MRYGRRRRRPRSWRVYNYGRRRDLKEEDIVEDYRRINRMSKEELRINGVIWIETDGR